MIGSCAIYAPTFCESQLWTDLSLLQLAMAILSSAILIPFTQLTPTNLSWLTPGQQGHNTKVTELIDSDRGQAAQNSELSGHEDKLQVRYWFPPGWAMGRVSSSTWLWSQEGCRPNPFWTWQWKHVKKIKRSEHCSSLLAVLLKSVCSSDSCSDSLVKRLMVAERKGRKSLNNKLRLWSIGAQRQGLSCAHTHR